MVCEGWEGLTVDGRFPLLEWLGGWGDRCVFLTVRQGVHQANIKLIQTSDVGAETHISRWEVAKAYPHPSLMQLMETGRYHIRDTDIAYVVTEKADNFLSGLIPQRTLSAEQMREILAPVMDALEFLHEKDFVHGSVKPSSIVLVNTEWKLSPDEMAPAGEPNLSREMDTYDAPETGTGILTGAADMWSLGMILVEACSQRTPVWDRKAIGDLGVPDWLPEPFREIARGCLRWEPGARISAAEARQILARMPMATGAASRGEPVVPAVKDSTIESRPAVATLAERVAEVRSEGKEELQAPPSRTVAGYPAAAAEQQFEPELHELTPRSRLFSNLEDERPNRTGPVLFALFVLIAIGAVVGVRYRDRLMPLIQRHSASVTSKTSDQAAPPQSQAAAPVPATPASAAPASAQSKAQTESAPPAYAGAGVSNPQNPPAQPGAEQPQTAEQPQSSAKNPPASQAPTAPPEAESIKPEEATREEAKQTPRVMNAKGAVASRVMPNVAPGARDSMRRPVQVDVRVMVDAKGRVTSAQSVTHSRGNYWARISQQAAEGWKFKAPVSGGRPRDSYWMLLFQYNRGRTEVVARELR